MRAEAAQLKKDKLRLEKQLESKEQYLNTLKTKQDKPNERSEEAKENAKAKELRDAKNHYELKLKHLRKERDELHAALHALKNAVVDKVEESVARSIPTGKRKPQEYEAAKLLGLKANELDEFLNPTTAANRKIGSELEQLWEDGNYEAFIGNFLEYMGSHPQ